MTSSGRVFYLKRVYLILGHEEMQVRFAELRKKLERAGMACEALSTDVEVQSCAEGQVGEELPACGKNTVTAGMSNDSAPLCITDDEAVLKKLLARNLPVAVCLHEKNNSQNLSAAKYAFEQPEELDAEYLERVYRRYRGIPWDILETERCILRESVTEDVEAFYKIYSEPSIARYTDGLNEYLSSERGALREYIEKVYPYYEFGIWTVILKKTGEIIGRAGLNMREGYGLPELGYVIGLPWQKKGLAAEVCQAILNYAETELGLDEIQAVIHCENIPSLNLAKKLGFCESDRVGAEKKEYVFLVRKG